MQERKRARILVTVCTDKFYNSLLQQGATAICEYNENFQDSITNYFSETVTSVVRMG
jgi:hypothetical protein